ncbi:zinc finger homeobox protein 4-like isoform X35 [Pomacea canaliculata]|uniref:zinc finger homeobox protein 4-like isoform X35 n=1 Tax=Pomacea canaliculata TaxID=400727 RepID=UPI000D739451|nr:zinc finger homeobox protein 4-like isoform X35 [Pomacea canaliculata]
MDEESASKFINALIKSVQTLCHGYVDFNNGVEIIGYINLSVDKGSSFDYVLKEKVCKNEENSTLFISNSFHAQPKPDKPVKAKNGQVETHISQRRHSVDTSESNQLSSAISSISTVLSGSHSQEKSRSIFSAKDSPASSSSSSSHHIQSTAKRKGEDDVNHDHPPKAANLSHESSSQHFFHPESSPHVSATSSPVDSKPSMSDVAGNVGESSRRTSTVTSEEMQPHIAGTMLPQTATVTSDANSDLGVNLASSVLERIDDQSNSEMQEKDDSDLDLEVTFIKEEYVEGERSACEFQNSGGGQYGRGPDQRASTSSDSMADTPLYPVALHTSAAAATFAPGSHEMAAMAQHYSGIPSSSLGIGAGPSTSHQPGPSGMRGLHEFPGRPEEMPQRNLLPSSSRTSYIGLWTKTEYGCLQCKECGKVFRSQVGLHTHIRQHHIKSFKFVCKICSKGFMVKSNYIGHMNSKHYQIKPFECPHCRKTYVYKKDLQYHISSRKCNGIMDGEECK